MSQASCNVRLTHGEVPLSLLSHPQGLIAVMEPHSSFHIHLTCAPETTILCAVGGLSVKTGNEIDWDHDPGYRIRADGKLDLTGFEQFVASVVAPVPDGWYFINQLAELIKSTSLSDEEREQTRVRIYEHSQSPEVLLASRRRGGSEQTPSEMQTDVKFPFLSKGRKTRFLAIEVRWYAPADGRFSASPFPDDERSKQSLSCIASQARDWERSKKPEMTRMIICVPHSQLRRFGFTLPL